MSLLTRFDVMGLHYAVRIFLGTTVVWILLRSREDAHAVWAVISVIVVTDPQIHTAWLTLGTRIVNTIVGCVTGLAFLLLGGPTVWVMPLAVTATVLLCTYIIKLSSSWRLAPATAALVIASGVVEQSRITGADVALHRTGEIVLGCVVAFLVTWCLSKVWMPPAKPD